ncbi:MAG TPA: energy-coupling factor transporter transmembrane component T [Candidatus Limnocylindria bacterium]|nr:energy-coupling factor transporter transmembrane component T [Candidatus Limnocylindria bacterium]
MIPFTPLRPNREAALPRANPAAKLGAAVLLMGVVFISTDPVTPAIVLAGLALATAFSGLAPGVLVARAWPLLVAALAVAVLNTLFAAEQAGEALAVGPLRFGSSTTAAGMALALRLLAIAYAGVLAMATTDPTDLADSLSQQLGLSPRYAVGALAAARLLPVLAAEWQLLALARRARGVEAGRSPLAAAQLFFGQLLSLLVGTLRRATRLALAMESRGFGSLPCRTVARPQRLERRDWVLLAAAAGLGAAALGISVALGTWRFLLS